MFSRIMVPVDGSVFAEQALRHAVALAGATGATLHLVLVHQVQPFSARATHMGSDLIEAQLRDSEEGYLDALAQRIAAELPAEASVALLNGDPAAELERFAVERGIDLIVMSTHGRSGISRAWLGSVADALIRRLHVPVLLVRPDESAAVPAPRFTRVLIAVDDSASAEAAIAHGATLCAMSGAACTLTRVVVPPVLVVAPRRLETKQLLDDVTAAWQAAAEQYLRGLAASRAELPQDTRTEVVTGASAAAMILQAAEAGGADVIVVGTQAHSPAARLLIGSVADKVIRGAQLPVLVCPVPHA